MADMAELKAAFRMSTAGISNLIDDRDGLAETLICRGHTRWACAAWQPVSGTAGKWPVVIPEKDTPAGPEGPRVADYLDSYAAAHAAFHSPGNMRRLYAALREILAATQGYERRAEYMDRHGQLLSGEGLRQVAAELRGFLAEGLIDWDHIDGSGS